MIITKSISRFARNTVTLLSTVRELKDLGVDVFFEEQNIHTIGAEGELLLTLLAAFAQAESLSVSENCKWRIRNGFEEGRPTAFRMLGYRLKDGEVTVVPEETETVQRIFELYLQGYGTQRIANTLNEEGHRTVNGGLWWPTTIGRIIGNEKYSGDLLLQKFFVPDHLSKVKHFNRGELPIHTVEDNHEAIIEKPMFRQAAARQRARSFQRETKQTHSALTGMICCACCGRSYNRKTTTGGVKWCCVTYNTRGKTACPDSKMIPESTLLEAVCAVLKTETFDEDLFRAWVDQIIARKGNVLQFVFKDGSTQEYIWKDRSRAESWTQEMKEAARLTAARRNSHGG